MINKIPIINLILRYFKYRRIRNKINKVYFKRLFKASLLLSIIPNGIICIFLILNYLTITSAFLSVIAVILGMSLIAKPYLSDFATLANYLDHLSHDRKVNAPTLGVLGNLEDLSEKVKNFHYSWNDKKLKLESSLIQSKVLFNALPDIIIILDKKFNIIRANNAALNRFENKIIGANIKQLIKEVKITEHVKNVTKTGRQQIVELSILKDNVETHYTVKIERFPLYSIDGISVIIVMHDITELKKTKQMMKDFIANASHEIRTPMTSIEGFIETLLTMDKKDDKNKIKFLNIMATQTKHITSLVNDLLSLSKIEINESLLPEEKIQLNDVINIAIDHNLFFSKEKNMKIISKIDKKLPLIYGDRKELSQVFINLINNSIKYGYKDSNINISSNIINHKGKKYIDITIEDKSDGIKKEHIPRLTERFYRTDKARNKEIGGTGLGLTIVKHILNHHRGNLIIESKENIGSKFTTRLPII